MSGVGAAVPMVPYAMFSLFPMAAVHRSQSPAISVAFGPFLLLTHEAYLAAGGHAASATSPSWTTWR